MFIKTLVKKNKALLTIYFILIIICSFEGVLLSSIIFYGGKFTKSSTLTDVLWFAVCSLLAWFTIYSAQFLASLIQSILIKKTNLNLKILFVRQLWYVNQSSSDVISTLTNDFKVIENNYFAELFTLIESFLLMFVSTIYMLSLSTTLAIIFILFSLLPLITPLLFKGLLEKSVTKWTETNNEAITTIKDFFQGIHIFKTYGKNSTALSIMYSKILKIEQSFYLMCKKHYLAQFFGSLSSGFSFILPFSLGCFLIISNHGNFSFNILLALFLANDRVIGPIRKIVNSFNAITGTRLIRKKITSIFQLKTEKKQILSTIMPNKASFQTINPPLFKAINISYRINKLQSLDFSLNVYPQDKILILGESGVGKSTLLKLLNGSLQRNDGYFFEISKDNHVFNDPYNDVGYVEQTPYIFTTTLLNNIVLFDKGADTCKVNSILEKVSLHKYFNNLNIALAQDENGRQLSGGQKQKIELSRALFAEKKLILVDEITANLDQYNADKIRDILFNLPQPVIEVAHHYNVTEKRYTHILKLNKSGNLTLIK